MTSHLRNRNGQRVGNELDPLVPQHSSAPAERGVSLEAVVLGMTLLALGVGALVLGIMGVGDTSDQNELQGVTCTAVLDELNNTHDVMIGTSSDPSDTCLLELSHIALSECQNHTLDAVPTGTGYNVTLATSSVECDNETLVAELVVDTDPTNELQGLSLVGDTLGLSLDAATVDLSGYTDVYGVSCTSAEGDAHNITVALTGNPADTCDFSLLDAVNDSDADPLNELQALGLVGTNLTLSQDGWVDIASTLAFNDTTNILSLSPDGSSVNLTSLAGGGGGGGGGCALHDCTLDADEVVADDGVAYNQHTGGYPSTGLRFYGGVDPANIDDSGVSGTQGAVTVLACDSLGGSFGTIEIGGSSPRTQAQIASTSSRTAASEAVALATFDVDVSTTNSLIAASFYTQATAGSAIAVLASTGQSTSNKATLAANGASSLSCRLCSVSSQYSTMVASEAGTTAVSIQSGSYQAVIGCYGCSTNVLGAERIVLIGRSAAYRTDTGAGPNLPPVQDDNDYVVMMRLQRGPGETVANVIRFGPQHVYRASQRNSTQSGHAFYGSARDWFFTTREDYTVEGNRRGMHIAEDGQVYAQSFNALSDEQQKEMLGARNATAALDAFRGVGPIQEWRYTVPAPTRRSTEEARAEGDDPVVLALLEQLDDPALPESERAALEARIARMRETAPPSFEPLAERVHVGMTAQQLTAAFGVGDGTHINLLDQDGAQWLVLQGLLAYVDTLEARLAALEAGP